MQIQQAIRLFVEDLKLAPEERSLVCAMFGANEIALRGEETLMPLVDALQALSLGHCSQRNLARMNAHISNILHVKYKHDVGGPVTSLPVFLSISVTSGSTHIVFAPNPRACSEIEALIAMPAVDLDDVDDD